MSLRYMVAALSLSLLAPGSCGKMLGKKDESVDPEPSTTAVATPVPLTSATTPPIWHPPDTAPPPETATPAAPPPSAELVKARAAFEAQEFKKVKALLEKRVLKSTKGSGDEAKLLYRACLALKDATCTDAVKAKHPQDATD